MRRCVSALGLVILLCAPAGLAAQSALVEAKTSAGAEVATIRTDSMRLLVPLHLLVGGLVFPDGTVQTTAGGGGTGGGGTSVTSAQIVDGTIVNADISDTAAIADRKLATISSAGKVTNNATTATSFNTPNAIVARDPFGGFSSGYILANDSVRVRGEGSFLATGTFNPMGGVQAPASGAGTRMLWYPERAAFRVGYSNGTNWDTDNLGYYSIAGGFNTLANAQYAIAFGFNAQATAIGATSLGSATTASGTGSLAGGGATASGDGSVALGSLANASGVVATAIGSQTVASGMASAAMGALTTASGNGSTAVGYQTAASGLYSTAMGYQTKAIGTGSTALGWGTTAQSMGSLVIGQYNVLEGSPTILMATDPVFAVGNGTDASAPSNALTLHRDGNLFIAGTLTQSSDARLKEDIEPLGGTLDRVMQLTPIRYRFRPGTGRPAGEQIGLTAQQVQPLFPELVKQGGDGYLSLSYANLSAVLVKTVQEEQAEIEPLQDQVTALKARNAELESELASMRASQAEILRRLRTLEAGKGR